MAKGKEGVDIVIDGKHITAESLSKNLSRAGEFMKKSLDPNQKYVNIFLNKEIIPTMRASINRRFQTKTDPSGKPWHKLSPFTIVQRTKKGTLGKGILEDTGRLRKTIKTKSSRTTGVVSATSPISYALIHQPPPNRIKIKGGIRGTWITKGQGQISDEFSFEKAFIPERVFIGWDVQGLAEADALIMGYIKEEVRVFLHIISIEAAGGVEQYLEKRL